MTLVRVFPWNALGFASLASCWALCCFVSRAGATAVEKIMRSEGQGVLEIERLLGSGGLAKVTRLEHEEQQRRQRREPGQHEDLLEHGSRRSSAAGLLGPHEAALSPEARQTLELREVMAADEDDEPEGEGEDMAELSSKEGRRRRKKKEPHIRGISCEVPLWKVDDFVCLEALTARSSDKYEDDEGNERMLMYHEETCTIMCPHEKWWSSPDIHEMECFKGIWYQKHTEEGEDPEQVFEINCHTSVFFYVDIIFWICIFLCLYQCLKRRKAS
eukprot:CAMPEP_0115434218 /NCGR_PEP_ID=MMETSP0271-20121206/33029_1 /TAXON_ID=71861 /ORGANISM="Scrippsiella trochoidea, Strain CCMP3099" /LENGTH=272 /DNA_ID=CAMNT_0002859635 /DNA_START=36 /DNA_END=850 /DNA_ORIENTATION=+